MSDEELHEAEEADETAEETDTTAEETEEAEGTDATVEEGARSGLAVKWIVLLVVAVAASVVLWNFVFPWVMTLLPENF